MKNRSKFYLIENRLLNKFWTLFRRATLVALLFLFNGNLFAEAFKVRALWIVRDHVTTRKKIDGMRKIKVRGKTHCDLNVKR